MLQNMSEPKRSRAGSSGCLLAALIILSACAPAAVTQKERLAQARKDMAEIFRKQEPVRGQIDLYEAMARALKYNLDRRVRAMEVAFAAGQFNLAKFDLLPTISGSAEYRARNNLPASSSQSVTTGRQSLEPSISQERERRLADTRILWSVLDFGVSFVRLKQEGNRIHIAREARRKVTNNLLFEVRRAYWRQMAAQSVGQSLRRVIGAAQHAIFLVGKAQREGVLGPRVVADYRRRLSRTILAASRVQQNLALSRAKLASLMNMDPATGYTVVQTSIRDFRPPQLAARVPVLRTIALIYRPELYEADYLDRIARLEKYVEILSALPGLRLEGSFNYDSNRFLNNNIWYEFGARLTVQLQRLISLPARLEQVEARKQLFALRRKTATLAVVTQVHIAHQTFFQARRNYRLARVVHANEWQSFRAIRATERSSAAGRTEFVEAWANLVLARLNLMNAYADLQAAYGRVLDSVGIDPALPKGTPKTVAGLRAALRVWYTQGIQDDLKARSESAERAIRTIKARKPTE